MENIGERIKKIRVSKGLSQADLAKLLNTTSAAICRYELGKREIRPPQAESIAEALGVPVTEIYGFPSEEQVQRETTQKTLAMIFAQVQRDLEENPDEPRPSFHEVMQSIVNNFSTEGSPQLGHTSDSSEMQADAITPIDETDDIIQFISSSTDRRQRKRLVKLIKIFVAYPNDAQNRTLEIVTTLGRLNKTGQKNAVTRIKELAELPRYQTKQEDDNEKT